MGTTVTVCRSCPAGRSGLASAIRTAIEAAGLAMRVSEVDCMSGCTRPSTVAVRAPGKTAYLFGDASEADVPNLIVFLKLYDASADGNLADARPIGALREKALARIPG
jgi:predicted metal-binding protein